MKFTLMTLFYILFGLVTIGGVIWTVNTGGADGSWLAIVVPAAIGLGVARYTKKSTGSYTSDSAGGR